MSVTSRRRVQKLPTSQHTRAQPPYTPRPLSPPSHRRYGSVRSRVSVVESDLNTGQGTDKQTQQQQRERGRGKARRVKALHGARTLCQLSKKPRRFWRCFFFSLVVYFLVCLCVDKAGYLNWTCELRELTRRAALFPRWSSSLASSSLWWWSDRMQRSQVSTWSENLRMCVCVCVCQFRLWNVVQNNPYWIFSVRWTPASFVALPPVSCMVRDQLRMLLVAQT